MKLPPQRRAEPSGAFRSAADLGFTLVELLVVLAIIGLLAAVAYPALSRSLESSRTAKCLGNLKQLGQATLAYSADNNQFLPPTVIVLSQGGMKFWYTEIRPYLGATNTHFQSKNLEAFYCPCVPHKDGYPHTQYACNNHVFGNASPKVPDEISRTRLARIPSPSQVVMYTENAVPTSPREREGTWQLPADWARNNPDFFLPHRHGNSVNMVFCDGHAKSIPRAEVVANFTNYFGNKNFWR
jgi:prepilin-type N-terminal cleavage/methylation domain-containing protein/prepilin-type processing-associated H-X9-DG protein